MLLLAVHGRKPKIRHKNMTDGITANGRCHGGQIYIYIYIYKQNNR